MSRFELVPYADLDDRQKENHNFHKVAARLANYGFNSLRLTADWQGADFIACHIDGETFLKVQLKGRLVADKKYLGKEIRIAFIHGDAAYLYDHDRFMAHLEANGHIGDDSVIWHHDGYQNWRTPPALAISYLEEFRI